MNDTACAGPRVCVLLPVRNGAPTLVPALDSLRAQDFRDFRVVVVDDGSTDETPRLLRAELTRWGTARADGHVNGGSVGLGTVGNESGRAAHPTLSIVRLEPGAGIAGALAAAAQAAGDVEYLARQDADDASHPGRLARQVEFLDAHPEVGLVATGVHLLSSGPREEQGPDARHSDGWLRYERWMASCTTPDQIALGLWRESPFPHPTVMMRRDAYEQAGGYRQVPWAEDYDLWLRMLRTGIRMAKLPEPLYDWLDHPARASRTLPAYTAEAFHACRAHHLARHLGDRGVIVWGAGRDGRRAARAMLRQGIDIRAFLDIDPRKIGRIAHGRPILAADEWLATRRELAGDGSAPGTPGLLPIVLAAVGTEGARELIQGRLRAEGLHEGPDYLCIA